MKNEPKAQATHRCYAASPNSSTLCAYPFKRHSRTPYVYHLQDKIKNSALEGLTDYLGTYTWVKEVRSSQDRVPHSHFHPNTLVGNDSPSLLTMNYMQQAGQNGHAPIFLYYFDSKR